MESILLEDKVPYLKQNTPKLKTVFGMHSFEFDKENRMVDFFNESKEIVGSICFDELPYNVKAMLIQLKEDQI